MIKIKKFSLFPSAYRAPIWVLLLGISITLLAGSIANEINENSGQKSFHDTASLLVASIQSNIEQQIEQLNTIKRFYESSGSLKTDEFASFSRHEVNRRRGALAISWLPKVPINDIELFTETARDNGMRQFTVQYPEQQMDAPQQRNWLFPILYHETREHRFCQPGLDPTPDTLLERLFSTDPPQPLLLTIPSAMNSLPAEEQATEDLLADLYMPLYNPVSGNEIPNFSVHRLAGLLYTTLDMNELIHSAMSRISGKGLGIHLYLFATDAEQALLLLRKDRSLPAPLATYRHNLTVKQSWSKQLRIGNERLEVVIIPSEFRLFSQSAELTYWLITAAGILLTLALFSYLIVFVRRSEHHRFLAENQMLIQQEIGDDDLSASGNNREGLWATDKKGITTFVNGYIAELLGYTPDELVGQDVRQFLDGVGRKLSKRNIIKHRRGINEKFELALLRRDGTRLVVGVSTAPFFDDDGNYDGALATLTDLTESRRSDKHLLINEAKFKAITEYSSDITLICDRDLHLTYISPSVEKLKIAKIGDLLGTNVMSIIHADDRAAVEEIINYVRLKVGSNLKIPDFRIIEQSGKNTWFNGYATGMIDVEGVDGIVISGRNVHDKRMQKILKEAHNKGLEQLSEGTDLEEVLCNLLITLERLIEGSRSSIHLLDRDLRTLKRSISPSLDDSFKEMMNGTRIAPGNGASATAVYRNERIICEDVTLHPFTAKIMSIAAAANLRASWAEPVFSTRNEVIGVVTVYFSHTTVPDEPQLELLRSAAQFTGIAIERYTTEEALRESEIKWRALIAHMPDNVALLSLDGKIRFANRVAQAYNLEEVVGKSLIGYVHEDYKEPFQQTLDLALKTGKPQSIEIPLNTPKGTVWWSNRIGLMKRAGNVDGFIAIGSDITERKKIELSLQTLSSAVEQSGSSVIITNIDGIIEYVNPRFTEITGYASDEVKGKTPSILQSNETQHSVHRDMWKTILDGKIWYGEIRNRRKNGELFWTLETISPIQDKDGKITHFVAVSEDLTNLKETQREMERLTFYDSLTGLENRRLFRDRLEQSMQGINRLNHSHSIALLYLDLDQFKRINDTLGHDAGDQLLKTIANRLRSIVKSGDTVARLGGDEFALLLTHIKGSSDTGAIARRIFEALNEPIRLANQDVIVTTSIGITLAPEDTTDPNVLMKNADLAMYRAKELGRNNYQFYTEEMNVEALGRLFLENELRNALEKQQFVLYYQPILDFKCQRMKGVEVLIRWDHPERGLISPEQFIPVAEETGLIVPLGKWIAEEACRQAQVLQQYSDQEIMVSVNLSARQFSDPALPSIIEQALQQSGLSPSLLELEITESMLMERLDDAIETLNYLKSFGLSLAIDDFGTGYSSLSYLKRLPINKVKVDKSFVCEIPYNRNDMEITTAVIAMAHKLHLRVTAEGIETRQQLEFLQTNNCDFGQGFYYSKPLDFATLVSSLPIELPKN